MARHFAEGGSGAEDLAHEVVRLCAQGASPDLVYPDELSLWEKLRAVATKVRGAADISAPDPVLRKLKRWEDEGHGRLPICVATTPYPFTTDPSRRGAPSGHTLDVRDVRLSAGAGFVVFICGAVMTMPGLPKVPAATRIDVDDDGRITGLF